jgi:glycosyltransferase involved in cell wall biosynthesis
VAGYIGTHGLAHGLDTLLQAAAQLRLAPGMDHVRLIFLGDGAVKARLETEAQRLGLKNVLFFGTVPKEQVARWWSLLDVSIIHLKRTELFNTVIPSKLFECMGMGIPVLHGVKGESAEIVVREDVGRLFEAEDATDLAKTIAQVAADPDLLLRWRENCISSAVKYDRATLADQMLLSLERARANHA